MDNQYDTLSEATSELSKRGYTIDFNLVSDGIECRKTNEKFKAADFHIDEFHRFEGNSNPADMSIVFAVSTTSGKKGTLIDAYGTYSDSISAEVLKKIKIH